MISPCWGEGIYKKRRKKEKNKEKRGKLKFKKKKKVLWLLPAGEEGGQHGYRLPAGEAGL